MEELKNWFLQNSPREQLMLSVGAVAVSLCLLYIGVLAPLADKRDKQRAINQTVLNQQEEVRELAQAILGQRQSGGSGDRSLAQLTNSTMRNHGLTMEQFQPTGNNSVRVRFGSVEYNKIMAWLDELENKEGVQVSEVSVTASDVTGLLSNATVKLHRN